MSCHIGSELPVTEGVEAETGEPALRGSAGQQPGMKLKIGLGNLLSPFCPKVSQIVGLLRVTG